MEPRTRKGRPRREDPPAQTRKVTVKLPVELVPIFEKLAEDHGRSLHAELRAALAFWAEAHTAKAPDKEAEDPS